MSANMLCSQPLLGYPMIGAGLAGGNWKTIADIIQQELVGNISS
ncbi:hypothetical protein RISK_000683 [Rhodopirellula islandica]|uniref:Uncharacterized protein n=1 Tax=Rhodopirellula islandica TaxID=595434 RepID=A0A0J1BM89_RHOIS|nr:hypothetical protein RISK_000683 [Rhodopirellula islandica]